MIAAAFKSRILDVLPAGVYVCDRDGAVLHFNQRAVEMWGVTPAIGQTANQFLGNHRLFRIDGSLLPPNEYPAKRALLEGVGREDYEIILQRPDGQRIYLSNNCSLLRDDKNEFIGAINCFIDITERKRTEAQLNYHLHLTQTITEYAGDSLFLLDREGRATFVNPAAERTFGWRKKELLGRILHDIIHDPYDRGPSCSSDCLLRPEAHPIESHEDHFLHRDGHRIAVSCSRAPIVRDGVVSGSALVVQDISARREAQQELIRAKESAEHANQAKDHFLAALSHELRTPLAPVLMSASAMEADASLPSAVRAELAMIRHNIELEARLIDDLLDLTRVSRGKLELHFETVDVHAIVRQAAQKCCASDIHTKRLNLAFDLAADMPFVRADPARLQQVFWNLLKNAIKFTPAGGSIVLRSRTVPVAGAGAGRSNRQLVFEISDTGIGIATEALPRIFDAFEQGSRDITCSFGGLGLGLAISKAIVDLHGGAIRAHSDGPGAGATFSLQIPACAAPTDFGVAAPAPAGRERGLSILLVEDHEDTSRVLARLLKRAQHEVQIAGNVNDALRAAGAQRFDLLISDLGLPDGSGLDLMRQLAELYQLKGIALSGYGMDDDIRKSRESGFSAHLTKPVDFSKLQAAIHQLTA